MEKARFVFASDERISAIIREGTEPENQRAGKTDIVLEKGLPREFSCVKILML